MSETAQAGVGEAAPGRPPQQGRDTWATLRRGAIAFGQQREATVFVVAVALFVYFSLSTSTFLSTTNLPTLLSGYAAPLIIIAIGEVFLLICGEIDLSVGMTYTFAPFLMHYLVDFYGVPAVPAILLSLIFGLVVGWINAFITVTVGVPSFITTLGSSLVLLGLVDTTSHAFPANIPPSTVGIGKWIGAASYAQFIWAVALAFVFHLVLRRTRWGLHTIATGGNQLGAKEAGVRVARIKYGNFMITGLLGALVGLQVAFSTNTIDPSSGGYQPMFYAVAAAVIGGTAMLGGVGTIIGAFLGAIVLAILQDAFTLIGISANPLNIIFGGAILVAMIANVQLTRLRGEGRA